MIRKALKLIAIGALAIFIMRSGLARPSGKDEADESSVPASAKVSESYTLREYDSVIGVFREDETAVPEEIYTVYVRVLPEKDRLALRKGITVSGTEHLRGLIEDLTG